MTGRTVSLVSATVLVAAAVLFPLTEAHAGGTNGPTALTRTTPPATPAPVVSTYRTATQSVTITVVPANVQPVEEPLAVSIRGLDGSVRRFAVEGGSTVIQTQQIILRAGESVTVQWRAAR
jgi:hypothetical protein